MDDYGRTFKDGGIITNTGTSGTVHISANYDDAGTLGTGGRVVNIYYGTAATSSTTGIPDGSIYIQYTA